MSFRNGDKSREHRIRKARQKKRQVTRDLVSPSKPVAKKSKAVKKT